MIHIRERPPLRTTTTIDTPAGGSYRWASDEPQPENTPSGLRWSSTMPGGFESFDASLPRKGDTDYSDLDRLSTITVRDAGWDIVGEYRLEAAPSSTGERMTISPSAAGWQAHLDDNKGVVFLGLDQTLTRWEEMTPARRAQMLELGFTLGDLQVGTPVPSGTGGDESTGETLFPLGPVPAVHLTGPNVGDVDQMLAIVEAHYDAGLARVGRVLYDYITNGRLEQHTALEAAILGGSSTPTPWRWNLTSSDAVMNFGSYESAAIDASAVHGNGEFAPATARRFITAQFEHAYVGAPALGFAERLMFRQLAVTGDHDLPVHLEPSSGWTGEDGSLLGSGGIYDADLIRYAISQWAPLLNFAADSFLGDPYIVGQAAWLDPTTLSPIVRDINRFTLNDWAVWDRRTFYRHPRGARGRSWRARVTEASLEDTGPQIDRVWESIIVSYQDVDGTTVTVGPPGAGTDIEDAALQDSDPTNPAIQAGIIRRDLLSIGVSTAAGAIDVGRRFLEQQKLLDSSGRARIFAHVEDDRGFLHPYNHIRAGDTIRFVDASDTSPRRIVRADNDEDSHTCSLDLDAPPEGLEALLERLGAALIRFGL